MLYILSFASHRTVLALAGVCGSTVKILPVKRSAVLVRMSRELASVRRSELGPLQVWGLFPRDKWDKNLAKVYEGFNTQGLCYVKLLTFC